MNGKSKSVNLLNETNSRRAIKKLQINLDGVYRKSYIEQESENCKVHNSGIVISST